MTLSGGWQAALVTGTGLYRVLTCTLTEKIGLGTETRKGVSRRSFIAFRLIGDLMYETYEQQSQGFPQSSIQS